MLALIEVSLSVLLVVSLKAIVLAIVAGAGLYCLRIRDSNLRHRVWTAVLLAMLLLPTLAWVTPSVPLPFNGKVVVGNSDGKKFSAVADSKPVSLGRSAAIESNVAQASLSAKQVDAPMSKRAMPKRAVPTKDQNQTVVTTSAPISTIAWTKWIFAVYAVGLTTMLGRLLLGIWSARRLAEQAQPLPSLAILSLGSGQYDIAASEAVRVPLTVGIVRPRVLLPADWSSWSAELLASVLRHEQSHIDRRDLLVGLLAEINRCVYWFHPLAWFLQKRVAALAEQSCDDSVISASGDRSAYAGHLLNIAARMSGVARRATPLGVSMARTSQVEYRIDAILDAGRPLARRLGWRRAATLTAVIFPLVLFVASVRAVDGEEKASDEQAVADKIDKSKSDADADVATDAKKGADASTLLNLSVPEGFWATFHVEENFGETTQHSFLKLVFLDKTTRQEQACRWIEAIQRYEHNEKEAVITRLLVPEEQMRLGVDALEKALVVLQRIGDQPPVDYTDADRSEVQTAFSLIMPVRHDDSQPHESEPVEFDLNDGKKTIPLTGWTNRRTDSVKGAEREIATRRWVMEGQPFPGVLKAQETIRQLDAEKSVVRTTTVTMADAGMGARSHFTDGPLSPFAITPGWEWALSPQSCNYSSSATRGLVIMIDKDDESFKLTLAYPWETPDGGHYIRTRPVAFDASRKRYEFKPNGGSASGGVGLGVFMFSKEVPIDSIVDIGIERLPKRGLKAFAESAAEPAREAGLEPLPFPIVGEPYTFSVTTTEEKTLRSEDLLGKVVLIDCWATWCGPCMAKMPKLKALYEKWHPEGFEVIGVNFDHKAKAMQKMVEAKELPWPQVLVPTDREKRELWKQASGITGIPRLLLLDRQGNLHADCSDDNLEQRIEQLMEEK